ncbi:MAG: HNH endonuclease, partial [Nocardioides sp.]
MFDATDNASPGGPAVAAGGVLDAATVAGWITALAGLDRDVSDAERVDQIRILEELKAAAAAGQARATVDLDNSVRAARAERGLPADRQGAGVGAQVALARRESPHRGGRHLGFGHALVGEMPYTLAGLTDGWLSEWRATLLVQGTACLSREDRAIVDQRLVADPATLDGVGDKELAKKVRDLAYRLDPQAALRRTRKAEADRRVTIRPAPETMVHLTALLPVKEGVAAYTALVKAADTARAEGDPRGRGQVMADTLVERITGRSTTVGTDLEVQVVITDRTLLHGDHEPAHVPGYGPIPAGLARDWLRPEGDAPAHDARVWLRRLYTHPGTGELVAMDSRRRFFDGNLRAFLIARDQTCRTPWCDAPIRHADHVVPHDAGGATSAADGQGLCEHCNHTKQAPGWRARPAPGSRPGRHIIETTTPTGHTYRSGAPPQPGAPDRPATAPP